jgi:hypothetical protein
MNHMSALLLFFSLIAVRGKLSSDYRAGPQLREQICTENREQHLLLESQLCFQSARGPVCLKNNGVSAALMRGFQHWHSWFPLGSLPLTARE